MSVLDKVKFDENGLIPAVVQDYKNGDVLMVAYMNRDHLKRPLPWARPASGVAPGKNSG